MKNIMSFSKRDIVKAIRSADEKVCSGVYAHVLEVLINSELEKATKESNNAFDEWMKAGDKLIAFDTDMAVKNLCNQEITKEELAERSELKKEFDKAYNKYKQLEVKTRKLFNEMCGV